MPKGGRETGTLLERCIKEFQDVSKYENDQRYLNVWLKYVSTKETYKSSQFLKHLSVNQCSCYFSCTHTHLKKHML